MHVNMQAEKAFDAAYWSGFTKWGEVQWTVCAVHAKLYFRCALPNKFRKKYEVA